jgi:hypothetical protein
MWAERASPEPLDVFVRREAVWTAQETQFQAGLVGRYASTEPGGVDDKDSK